MAKKPKARKGKAAAQPEGAARYRVFAYALAPMAVFVGFGTFVLACGGLLPTLVAYIVDKHKDRYAVKTVGFMNAAGVAIVAQEMWAGEHTWRKALELLGDPLNWLVMLGSAGVGWVLYFSLPPVVKAYLRVSQELRLKTLIAQQEKLLKEWGKGITRNAPDAEAIEAQEQSQAAKAVSQDGMETSGGLLGDEDESALLALVDSPETEAAPEHIESISEIGEKAAR